ncbi:leukocyte immunoglobulin-like receptor subfamily A member 6 [Monodelphis domestica]|uniref:leukocyte immunoglobulin-like receptor subfamily A member 6 n=1 Tax=Monodelphis domestica TaxID=13616 RepID=UPI0024E21BAB|nr:leukocyte immunoglobulin-like receptor subfamily A member 6 [Monodelphis domestica]
MGPESSGKSKKCSSILIPDDSLTTIPPSHNLPTASRRIHREEGEVKLVREALGGDTVQSWPWAVSVQEDKDSSSRHSSYKWSERSDPLQLVVTGVPLGLAEEGRNQHFSTTYHVPNTLSLLSLRILTTTLPALPSSEVASGQTVTLQCRSEGWYDWCVLCKEGEEISCGRTRSHGWRCQADFLFPAVTPTQDGTYRCFCFYSYYPSLLSFPSAPLLLRVSERSDPLELVVTGSFSLSPESENKPSDAAALDYTVGNLVRLTLAGLVLVLLGVLLAEHWKSSREQPIPGVLG